MSKPCITILNAGPGMGFYVPGIIMAKQLAAAGIPTQVHVFESFYTGDKKNIIPRMKAKFHKNFSFALMGHHMATDPSTALDEAQVTILLESWIKEERKHFIVFSGFWLSVLNRFLEMTNPDNIHVDLCHLDADYSVSWKMFSCTKETATTHWFHSWAQHKVNYYMNVNGAPPIPYETRNNNIVAHGGGWGLGDYEAKGEQLIAKGFNTTVIIYDKKDLEKANPDSDYYFLDPEWNIWDKNENNEHDFPPLFAIDRQKDNTMKRLDNSRFSPLYDLVSKSKAIISKPGAGTLIDSLSAATPLIILEPYGSSEDKNGLLWKELGLGMSFDDWSATGFSYESLDKMHQNLLNVRSETKNFITSYIINHGL